MVRLSRLTDYGMLLMSCFARSQPGALRTARDLAAESQLPLPTVTKLLKILLQSRLLISHRGIKGGYSLARRPQEISLGEIISALEGPVALTECSSTQVTGGCELEACCTIKRNQQIINRAVRGVLENLVLSDLIQPLQLTAVKDMHGNLIPTIGFASGRTQ